MRAMLVILVVMFVVAQANGCATTLGARLAGHSQTTLKCPRGYEQVCGP